MADEHVQFHRLGKRELGPYAFEEQMPTYVASILRSEDDRNRLSGVIMNLARLLESSSEVEEAYLCSENAVQIWKLPNEGAHFCGYRNIQILISALPSIETKLLTERPSILELQAKIEEAWANGINQHGLVLTGGIKGTRKHIGTSEAEALLLSLGISCTGQAFRGRQAWCELLNDVEAYFLPASTPPAMRTVNVTDRMPIFLQRPKHSLTIVGIERTKSGQRRLLTFDPAWKAPEKMGRNFEDGDSTGWSARLLLRRYRKSERSLKRFQAFELLEVELPPP